VREEEGMSEPIIFISRSRIKEGELGSLKGYMPEITELIKENKPGTVAMLAYVDEDDAEIRILHAFPDADAMARHLEGVGERAAEAFEYIETAGYEIYGSPGESVLESMRGYAREFGVPLTIFPSLIGGYLRV
jgi:hypothetical protein